MSKPVFGIDIDGTLGMYHDHFFQFAEGYLGKTIPRGYDGSVPMNKWCGVSKQRYRETKLAYRRGGLKRSMPCFAFARDLTVNLRKRGAQVVICTTRPYLQLDNIEPDTREWLRRNRIQHDDIISGEHKYRELKRRYGRNQIVAVLDDLPEMVKQAQRIGLVAVLRVHLHNGGFWWPAELTAADMFHAEEILLDLLGKWKAENG